MKRLLVGSCVVVAVVALVVSVGVSQGKVLKIGNFCDRLGPTQTVGVKYCPGFHDYMDLINSRGGIEGYKIEHNEVEHGYAVPKAVEGYNKFKAEGYLAVVSYGTPITDALKTFANRDKISLLTPGFGISDVEDATKFPYVFVGVASYKSQVAAIYQYIKEAWKENRAAKIAYLFYDNPAGRDPLDYVRELPKKLGNMELVGEVACPPPCAEASSQMLQIQRLNPDFVISHLFGKGPALTVGERAKLGMKATMISLVWGFSEDEVNVNGPAAEGYMGVNFVVMPEDLAKLPVAKDIADMYKKGGKEPPKEMNSIYYVRGIMNAALFTEAAKHAIKAAGGSAVTGEHFKKGMESIKDFTGEGTIAPTTITATNHAGSRKVRLYKVQGGKFVLVKDWFEGPHL
ncbi:MAG TPA: ABC transporter substrate-binding protein [Methylomirabilota bacterium]|jgi:branched-chain amino acid transport system substrate-binding protein|nr:ABC transporter substrate-binding protein [Methylomirabilota bacterium]